MYLFHSGSFEENDWPNVATRSMTTMGGRRDGLGCNMVWAIILIGVKNSYESDMMSAYYPIHPNSDH